MNKEQEQTKKPIILITSRSDDAIKITATAIVIIAGAWIVLKMGKEMLKEMEGMGL